MSALASYPVATIDGESAHDGMAVARYLEDINRRNRETMLAAGVPLRSSTTNAGAPPPVIHAIPAADVPRLYQPSGPIPSAGLLLSNPMTPSAAYASPLALPSGSAVAGMHLHNYTTPSAAAGAVYSTRPSYADAHIQLHAQAVAQAQAEAREPPRPTVTTVSSGWFQALLSWMPWPDHITLPELADFIVWDDGAEDATTTGNEDDDAADEEGGKSAAGRAPAGGAPAGGAPADAAPAEATGAEGGAAAAAAAAAGAAAHAKPPRLSPAAAAQARPGVLCCIPGGPLGAHDRRIHGFQRPLHPHQLLVWLQLVGCYFALGFVFFAADPDVGPRVAVGAVAAVSTIVGFVAFFRVSLTDPGVPELDTVPSRHADIARLDAALAAAGLSVPRRVPELGYRAVVALHRHLAGALELLRSGRGAARDRGDTPARLRLEVAETHLRQIGLAAHRTQAEAEAAAAAATAATGGPGAAAAEEAAAHAAAAHEAAAAAYQDMEAAIKQAKEALAADPHADPLAHQAAGTPLAPPVPVGASPAREALPHYVSAGLNVTGAPLVGPAGQVVVLVPAPAPAVAVAGAAGGIAPPTHRTGPTEAARAATFWWPPTLLSLSEVAYGVARRPQHAALGTARPSGLWGAGGRVGGQVTAPWPPLGDAFRPAPTVSVLPDGVNAVVVAAGDGYCASLWCCAGAAERPSPGEIAAALEGRAALCEIVADEHELVLPVAAPQPFLVPSTRADGAGAGDAQTRAAPVHPTRALALHAHARAHAHAPTAAAGAGTGAGAGAATQYVAAYDAVASKSAADAAAAAAEWLPRRGVPCPHCRIEAPSSAETRRRHCRVCNKVRSLPPIFLIFFSLACRQHTSHPASPHFSPSSRPVSALTDSTTTARFSTPASAAATTATSSSSSSASSPSMPALLAP
jgi:hypothetical protein